MGFYYGGLDGGIIGTACFLGLILIKEFSFDLIVETNEESGGLIGGLYDFLGCAAG